MKRTAWARLLIGAILLTYLWASLFSLVFRVSGVQAEDYRGRIGPDVEAQLAHIRSQLHAPDSVALYQPNSVWVVFCHTLYGFTLVNTVLMDPENEDRRAETIRELEWILDGLTLPQARKGFVNTQVPYGVFYLGEYNLTLAGLMLIDPHPDPVLKREYHQTSHLLYDAYMDSPSAHLDTFPGHAWPADNIPALYSLVVHDRLYGTNYGRAAVCWVEQMAATLDAETGLMASKINYESGEALDVPRGCGTSFTFAFLPDIDPDFARAQYAAYRNHFFKSTLGFVGMREYPADRGRRSDIDSGPIVLQVGAAATGIGIAATKAMGDDAAFESIVRLAEIIGFPSRHRGQKRYLFGQLLVGDEIQAWGKTIVPWTTVASAPSAADRTAWPPLRSVSLAPFYAIAGLTGVVLTILTASTIQRISRLFGERS